MLICNFQKLVTTCCQKERVWNPGLKHLRPKYLWLNMLPLLPLRETESCTAFTEHEQKSSHFQIQVIKCHRDHRASLTVGKGDTCLGNTKNGLPHLWGTQKGCPQDRRAKLFCIFVFSCIFQPIISQYLEAKLFPEPVSQWFDCKSGQHYMRHTKNLCGKWYFPYRLLEIFLNLNRKLMYLREERKQSPKPKTFPQTY